MHARNPTPNLIDLLNTSLEKSVFELENQVVTMQSEIKKLEAQIANMQGEIEQKDERIQALCTKNRDMANLIKKQIFTRPIQKPQDTPTARATIPPILRAVNSKKCNFCFRTVESNPILSDLLAYCSRKCLLFFNELLWLHSNNEIDLAENIRIDFASGIIPTNLTQNILQVIARHTNNQDRPITINNPEKIVAIIKSILK